MTATQPELFPITPRRPNLGSVERIPVRRGREDDAYPWPVSVDLTVCRWCERLVPTCCVPDQPVGGVCGKCLSPWIEEQERRRIAALVTTARDRGGLHLRIEKWRSPAPEPLDETRRKRRLAHAARAVERQREKAGFLVEMGVVTIESPEERVDRYQSAALSGWQRERDRRAQEWLSLRRTLRALPLDKRLTIVAEWNAKVWMPATPAYIASFMRQHGVDAPMEKAS